MRNLKMSKIGAATREKLGLLPEQKKLAGKPFSAIGVQQNPDGSWSMVEVTIQDGQVTGSEKTAPEAKAVAVEKFKIESARYLLNKIY